MSWFPSLPWWAVELLRPDKRIAVWFEIQGFGDREGVWRFCIEPGYFLRQGEGTWRPYIPDGEVPDFVSTTVDYIRGGFATSGGSLQIRIQDVEGEVRALFRPNNDPVLQTASVVIPLSTFIPVRQLNLDDFLNRILWVGDEAVRVVGVSPGQLTVERGRLGTVPRFIDADQEMYPAPPFLRDRVVSLYVAPLIYPDSESQKQLIGQFTVVNWEWTDDMTVLQLDTRIQDVWFSLRTASEPRERTFTFRKVDETAFVRETVSSLFAWPDDGFTRLGSFPGPPRVPVVAPVDKPEDVYRIAADRLVLAGLDGVAAQDPPEGRYRMVLWGRQDFRYGGRGTIGNANTRRGFILTSNWVDIILCILLSPANRLGRGAFNFDQSPIRNDPEISRRNYSGLPQGYGIGVPWERIDWQSFADARAQYALDLPNFILGPEPMKLKEVIGDILLAVGAFMYLDGTQIRLVLPRLPTVTERVRYTVSEDFVLNGPDDIPQLDLLRPILNTFSEVKFNVGDGDPVTSSWAGFGRLFDPNSIEEVERKTLEVDIPGATSRDRDFWARVAQRRLWATYRPFTIIQGRFHPLLWDLRIGENCRLELPTLPNPRTGEQGISGFAQLSERTPVLTPDGGILLELTLLLQPTERIGLIAPAAEISGVSPSGGNFNFTTVSGLHTDLDAPRGLPTDDLGPFEVGDPVQVMAPDGVLAPTVETVLGKFANILIVSGNFGGAGVVGSTITVPLESNMNERQREQYATAGGLPYWSWG